jgi:hypothetical protein
VVTRKINEKNYYRRITPPNGIKIAENMYYDQTEVSNIAWREYMHWNRTVFGSSSGEYLSTFPDTSVWNARDSCMGPKMRFYLYLPKYQDYPVVGISYSQAVAYSKWRSDRVFEYILHSHKIIKFDRRQSSKTYFTIERYFKGELPENKPDMTFRYYPEYRLPAYSDWKKAISYADSVEQSYFDHCSTPQCRMMEIMWPVVQSEVVPCLNDTLYTIPTFMVSTGFVPEKEHPLYNMRGNVCEFTSDSMISVGGGWIHNRSRIMLSDTFHLKSPNCWTGFRNVCEWKEYK